MEDKILTRAGEMFLSLGFKSVTMDDIAKELAMSKKTLYKYFSNKASLVSAATRQIHKEVENMITLVKSQHYNAIEEEFAIKAIFKEMLKNSKESPMYQLKKYYPEAYKELMEREESMFRDCNLDNLQKGIEQGFYREDIDHESIMKFYFTLIFGVFENDSFSGDVNKLLEAEYKVLEYHIRGIATQKGVQELEKQLSIINQK